MEIPIRDPEEIIEDHSGYPGEGDCQEFEITEPAYPWVETAEEQLRCFIYEKIANAEIDGNILVDNMSKIYAWIKTGEVPKHKKLREVKKETIDG